MLCVFPDVLRFLWRACFFSTYSSFSVFFDRSGAVSSSSLLSPSFPFAPFASTSCRGCFFLGARRFFKGSLSGSELSPYLHRRLLVFHILLRSRGVWSAPPALGRTLSVLLSRFSSRRSATKSAQDDRISRIPFPLFWAVPYRPCSVVSTLFFISFLSLSTLRGRWVCGLPGGRDSFSTGVNVFLSSALHFFFFAFVLLFFLPNGRAGSLTRRSPRRRPILLPDPLLFFVFPFDRLLSRGLLGVQLLLCLSPRRPSSLFRDTVGLGAFASLLHIFGCPVRQMLFFACSLPSVFFFLVHRGSLSSCVVLF